MSDLNSIPRAVLINEQRYYAAKLEELRAKYERRFADSLTASQIMMLSDEIEHNHSNHMEIQHEIARRERSY